MVTLSVSSSRIGSSALMASPTFLNQVPTVASLTDSPRVGTRISVAIVQILISCVFVLSVSDGGRPQDDRGHRQDIETETEAGGDDRIAVGKSPRRRLIFDFDDRHAEGACTLEHRTDDDCRSRKGLPMPVFDVAFHRRHFLSGPIMREGGARRQQSQKEISHCAPLDFNRPRHPRGMRRAVTDASTSGPSPERRRPDGRYSGRAGTSHRYGQAPIRGRGR
ncbi:hypothetical protein RHECNPAF_750064 [Rhizobium etli CNPAF512]|nr:hypothetical protein RHECNPAF_750064 [Rhizobium etli CNPAF512]